MAIFISHSSKDADVALKICNILEKNGKNCFIAPRDIRMGKEYAEEMNQQHENRHYPSEIPGAEKSLFNHILEDKSCNRRNNNQ